MAKEAEIALGGFEVAEQTAAQFAGVLLHLPSDYQLSVSEVLDLYVDVNRQVVAELIAEKRRDPLSVSPFMRAFLQHMRNKKLPLPPNRGVLDRLMADPQWKEES